MGFDRLLHLGGYGVQISFFLIPGVKIEHRQQQVAQLRRAHLGNVLVEVNIEIAAMRVVDLFVFGEGNRSSVGPGNLNSLIPLLAVNRPAIQIKVNVVVLNPDIGDVCRITGLDRRSPERQQLLQSLTGRRSRAVPENDSLTAHGEGSTRVHKLHLEVVDYFVARLLRHVGSIGRDWRRLTLQGRSGGSRYGSCGRLRVRSEILRVSQNHSQAQEGNRKENTEKTTHTPPHHWPRL